jgi:thymidylate synthase ThyX
MATAKIIADSISESGIRITTLELEFERFLLAQFNTHRQFSRSAQSSRAVPVQKMIDAILSDTHIQKFMANESGMQSTKKLSFDDNNRAHKIWGNARQQVMAAAQNLTEINVHKQFANRLLEPFSTVKVVVTATEWENFFALRLHHAAQPEMQALASAMCEAMNESRPDLLSNGAWHLPYINLKFDLFDHPHKDTPNMVALDNLALISAARCARVSYLNHDNSTPDIEKDLELAQRLLADKHLSPFEHQAKPMIELTDFIGVDYLENGVTHADIKGGFWSANFRGWIQHRQLVDL